MIHLRRSPSSSSLRVALVAVVGSLLAAGTARAAEAVSLRTYVPQWNNNNAAAAAAKQMPAPSPADALTVMSINLEHHDKPEEMKAMAANLKTLKRMPDFILCQEVYFERHQTAEHPEDNTAAVFANYLGYYCKGTKRTSDREGIAIISKYPFDHYESINLKSQTLRILLGFRRVSVMGEFTVPGVGKVRIADTHLTNWEWEGHVRNKQIAETLRWVNDRDRSLPAALTFFGGDFNAKTQWSEMRQIKTAATAATAAAAAGGLCFHDYNGTDCTQGSHGSPNKRIDFIFVACCKSMDAGLRFSGEQLLWKAGLKLADGGHFYPSDHLGVVHSYALPVAPVPANRIRTADVND